MKLHIFQVDAFADDLFKGNPAAVVPLQEWLSDEQMQQIAMENNLSETAFFIPEGEDYSIRWFTPLAEVILCGHATLATAHVLYFELGIEKEEISFSSKSGTLKVRKKDDLLQLDFPVDIAKPALLPENIIEGLKVNPLEVYKGITDYVLVYQSEEIIRNMQPDFALLKGLDERGIIVTAPGESVDFVSRFFAPGIGIDEDPVTGSAHTMLAPYWSARLIKNELTAQQLSARGGNLWLTMQTNRVLIAGKAVTYLKGEIDI